MSGATVPKPRTLILNLLLAAEGEPLTARAAVASCALFGLRENTVRVALVRLAAAGLIEASGRGAYVLGDNATGLATDVATWRMAERLVREWNGDWVGIHVGSLGRTDRVALRARDRALAMLGTRELDRGFYVRPDNLAGGVGAVRERLTKLGLEADAAVFVARAFDSAREERARKLWNGKALTESYRKGRRILEVWLQKADRLELEEGARESFLIGNDAIRRLVFDPLLPAPLVDVDERRAFADAVRRFDRAGHAIWRRWLQSDATREPAQAAMTH
jgi:phenylacetic acid degradation operon negative regulatory protein